MAQRPFKLPDIGEGTAEAELVAWHIGVGDTVAEDDLLCEVMTDKATVEVTAPFSGKVIERTGNPGDMLPVGGVVLVFDVEEEGAAPAPEPTSPEISSSASPPQSTRQEPEHRVLASPALRKRAADQGVNLRDVVGSGAKGRIRQSDVDAYLAYAKTLRETPRVASPGGAAQVSAISPAPPSDDVEEVPVIGLRRRISERMQDTKRRIPHFSYIEEVDVSQLEALRESLNATRGEHRPKLTLLPFLVRALTRVLPEFPHLNALYDDTAGIVRRHRAVHAGIATQTPQGLVVTVLRDAGSHDVWGVASELTRLSGLARSGRAAPADLTGSTITITSLGAMGGVATTPVINSPEVSIVGVNKVIERPIVDRGQIRIAKMMNLSSSFDHRVVDGWDAASFVQRVKAMLETPALLFVEA
ncbi:dihydrolipoamide acetyltransferase family protein [Novosphingobium sp.]|uniref:dihydrolipoamide acetyltransferase family protein n=1 Tax=Novosphingobium sp. TaxID=1874826 RepID=UPI002FD965B7